ncbi:MAG: ferredoxin [Candidatus Binatia bacterium]|nr:ferredoxin [Candidatus Binatia bacterium]
MKIRVDYDLCQGHGTCKGEAPEVFDVDDDAMQAIILQEKPEPALHDRVRQAAKFCPTNAIQIEEES